MCLLYGGIADADAIACPPPTSPSSRRWQICQDLRKKRLRKLLSLVEWRVSATFNSWVSARKAGRAASRCFEAASPQKAKARESGVLSSVVFDVQSPFSQWRYCYVFRFWKGLRRVGGCADVGGQRCPSRRVQHGWHAKPNDGNVDGPGKPRYRHRGRSGQRGRHRQIATVTAPCRTRTASANTT